MPTFNAMPLLVDTSAVLVDIPQNVLFLQFNISWLKDLPGFYFWNIDSYISFWPWFSFETTFFLYAFPEFSLCIQGYRLYSTGSCNEYGSLLSGKWVQVWGRRPVKTDDSMPEEGCLLVCSGMFLCKVWSKVTDVWGVLTASSIKVMSRPWVERLGYVQKKSMGANGRSGGDCSLHKQTRDS
jgi:hypothetical protein